jgi:hypothetical protein
VKTTLIARTLRSYYDKARDNGWAISADYTRKWCPNCAALHRHVGRKGTPRTVKCSSLSDGYEQTAIDLK